MKRANFALVALTLALGLTSCYVAPTVPAVPPPPTATAVPLISPFPTGAVPPVLPTPSAFFPSLVPTAPAPLTPTVEAATAVPMVLHPQSPPAEQGKAYPFTLSTHCGIDFMVDFDGKFWDAQDPSVLHVGLADPVQEGTMTLIDRSHARFSWPGGSIDYVEHTGEKSVLGMCA